MEKNTVTLDEEAEKLFRELDGLDSARKLESFSEIADLLANCLKVEEERLDKWRLHLLDAACHLSSCFAHAGRGKAPSSEEPHIKGPSIHELSAALNKLSKMPDASDGVLIKYQGRPKGQKIPPEIDYGVQFGDIALDLKIAQAMTERVGSRMPDLVERISKAFEILFEQGVNTLFVRLPQKDLAADAKLQVSLHIAARFDQAVKGAKPIAFAESGKHKTVSPVKDQDGVPDPNLTLVSALNNLGAELMDRINERIQDWIQSSGESIDDRHCGLFEAIFCHPALKKKLVKPPVELNNVKWLIKDKEDSNLSWEKTVVARHVVSKVSGPPEKKTKVLKSVYGKDYSKIGSEDFGERIGHVSELVTSMETDKMDKKVQDEVMENVRSRFEEVREEIFDDLFISEERIEIMSHGKPTILDKVNDTIRDMVTFFKGRALMRRKIKAMNLNFTQADYENLAKDFGVPVKFAEKIISLFSSCFDKKGRFQRTTFEKNIPAFAKYEKKAFDILWHFLKMIQDRKDRVAFLNSLQHLFVNMKHPEEALKVLMDDIVQDPIKVEYYDRNAFMLANLLVRTYNQELGVDIEITPEEVLEVRKGIHRKAVDSAVALIEADSESFLNKIRTIHAKLIQAIGAEAAGGAEMPLRFLLALEREACIFFSLVEGNTAKSVLRSAARGYGDPDADLYGASQDPSYVPMLLLHLRTIIRALGRLEDPGAVELLTDIRVKEAMFYRLGSGSQHENLVAKIMERARIATDAARKKA